MRVLIVRTSALGDIVHCLPVLAALRRHLPQARIGWVVEEGLAPLLEDHPDLDELLPLRTRPWRRRPLSPATLGELARFVTALERFAPDVVLDLMGNHKAGVIAALTLCDRRIGLARRFRREPSSAAWISEGVAPRGAHAVERALSALDALGLPREPPDFAGGRLLPPRPDDPPGPEAPYLVIHPGTAWGNKRYPSAWWGEVACLLGQETGLETLVTPGPGEEELARRVATASHGRATVTPVPSLRALGAVLRRARLVLGGDTGPVHLAQALGTRVLCLMGPTDPARTGPWGDPGAALFRRLPCSFCHRRFEETKACLLELPPARVAERALALLR